MSKVYVTIHQNIKLIDGFPSATGERRAQAWMQIPKDTPYDDEEGRYEVTFVPDSDTGAPLAVVRKI